MKKTVMSLSLVALMIFSLAACSAGSSVEPLEPTSENNYRYYPKKVYHVGTDIPAGGYVINCTSTNYSMDIVVFASNENYENFQSAKQVTTGEYYEAIELNAWANFFLYENENSYVGLQDGNVILLENGTCEFTKHDPSASSTLFSGIYVVGEDIDAGRMDIKCISDYLKVTIFKDKSKYLDYQKTSRFTNGEEDAAIDSFSDSSEYIYKDRYININLQDGMILKVERGTGEYSSDEGPIIN